MGNYLLESEVYFYKYTCYSCGNSIYCDYKNLGNCPHCGVECGEETKISEEELTATLFYEIDPKTGEVSVLHLCD
jgi:rRNA maturation endonuclease Nob1